MPRPSRNMDQKLLEAGLKLIPKFGFSGLGVRQVAKAAHVNLGMFHYYFKSKDEFTKKVLEKFYEDFFQQFKFESSIGKTPLEKLRNALLTLAKVSRDNRSIFLVLLKDVLHQHPQTIAFAKENMPRHISIIMHLIDLSQKAGLIKKIPKIKLLPYIMGATAMPNIVLALTELTKAERPFGMPLNDLKELISSDQAINERVDLVLKSISV